ncbi:uncharacterized protein LOC122868531 [Scomber scombrus]|uniref:Uncharacterized protein LOC122868531 n=1 Tax=Scomber scombrus TaxID=13677 RepID=A0AAV1PLT8_SCOSC
MTSSDSELSRISKELKHLSLKRQQLLDRKKILCIFEELKNRAEFTQTEETTSSKHEIDRIDQTLKQLCEKKADLQKIHDNIVEAKEQRDINKEVKSGSVEKVVPQGPESSVFYIVCPPDFSAPEVILDLERLPSYPCKTQCPECRQFITTETFTSVSSLTWLVCFMTALMGCVAGCCLIPFCFDKFKSTTHRCPMCRSSIQTIKKL